MFSFSKQTPLLAVHKVSLEDTPMKSMKALFVIAALTVSSLAMATGGGDKTFNRMESARKVSMEAYQVAQKQKADAAVAQSKAKAADHSNS
jgi:hypothetical protein